MSASTCGTVVLVLLVVVLNLAGDGHGEPEVPCYFIFGDSLADNGNNNDLVTLAKVNYRPYGIDFPAGPTGRFCNGRTIVDMLGQYLGFDDFIPPFATASGTEILFGVNYASGSAGILDETGKQVGQRISLNKQLRNHQTTMSRLVDILGSAETVQYLSKCLYTVGMGNNDYINNYFMPQYYNSSQQFSLEQFAQLLIDHYTLQLLRLHGYGARKIAIFGLGQIGCTPNAMDTYGNNASTCVVVMNDAVEIFNNKLVSLVDQLNAAVSDATFIYLNSSGMSLEASVLDFENATSGCCPVSSDGLCIRGQIPCKNRREYAFWDGFHPTEFLNTFLAARSYKAYVTSDAYPFDVQTLVSLYQGADAAQ